MLGCRDKQLLNADAIPRHPWNSLRHTLLSFLPTMALKSLYANRLRHWKCTKTKSVVWQDSDTDGSRQCWPRAHLGNASRESSRGQKRKGTTIERWIRRWCTRCCCFNWCPCCRRRNRSTKRRGKEGGKRRVRRWHGESITSQKYTKTHLTQQGFGLFDWANCYIFFCICISISACPCSSIQTSCNPSTLYYSPSTALSQNEILKTPVLVVRCDVNPLLSRTLWSGTCTMK